MTAPGIVIPWRSTSPERARAKDYVAGRLEIALPEARVIEADSGHAEFNRSASRNLGVQMAEDAGCDVVVVCDADSIPEESALRAAVTAANDGLLHLPYTRFISLSKRGTERFYRGTPWATCDSILDWDKSVGGAYVISATAWQKAGGQDERFRGWGCEDTAFALAAERALGPIVRHSGVLVHLWHPAERTLSLESQLLLDSYL